MSEAMKVAAPKGEVERRFWGEFMEKRSEASTIASTIASSTSATTSTTTFTTTANTSTASSKENNSFEMTSSERSYPKSPELKHTPSSDARARETKPSAPASSPSSFSPSSSGFSCPEERRGVGGLVVWWVDPLLLASGCTPLLLPR